MSDIRHDSTTVTDESATKEVIDGTGPRISIRGEEADVNTKDESTESSIGQSADQPNRDLDYSSSIMTFDAGSESELYSSEMDQSESSGEKKPERRNNARTAKAEKPKFKSRDQLPVAVIQTDGLQDEIQGLIDALSSRFNIAATEMTAKMDEILRRIDDLERVLR
ncbi:hypothetical protein V1525DRAFT_397510 [Lipomyces kononenkoae]|uniref:Uncharacterized protein n=1 Tax=Lipomyces kononenkoae TaxID=34357 RepID=A0ACC3T7J1_LIPKO